MDFSLNSNHFQRYINNNNLSQNNSDSFRNINNYQDLQTYFNNIKDTNTLKLYSLEQRFNQCLTQFQSFREEIKQDNQTSNEEKIGFQLQRYEDLLHYNFKEIQWVKTERMSQNNFQIPDNLTKIQKLLQKVQENINNSQKQQRNLELQLQNNIKQQLQCFLLKIDKFTSESITYKNDVKICIDAFTEQCEISLKSLQLKIKDTNQQLIKKIDIQLQQIENEAILLKK